MHGVAHGLFAREKKSGAGEKHSMIAMGDRMYTVCSLVSPFVNTVWSMTFLDDSGVGLFGNVIFTCLAGGMESL